MKPSDKPPFITWTQNLDGSSAQTMTPHDPPRFADPVYETINDVPLPLQHSLAYAYATGLTIEMLAIVCDNIKPEWIRVFVETWLENPPLREKH